MHHCEDHTKEGIKMLWAKVCDEFVTKKDVYKLVKELKEMYCGDACCKDNITKAVAAEVIKTVREDIDGIRDDMHDHLKHINSFDICLIDSRDSSGRPNVHDPKVGVLYLCPSEIVEYNDKWDEWLVIPEKHNGKLKNHWERIGSQKINLDWVKNDVKSLEEAILKLNNRINQKTDHLAKHILNNCIIPLQELKDYINSEDFKDEIAGMVAQRIGPASIFNDGLMTSSQVVDLEGLKRWVAEEFIPAQEVERLMTEN